MHDWGMRVAKSDCWPSRNVRSLIFSLRFAIILSVYESIRNFRACIHFIMAYLMYSETVDRQRVAFLFKLDCKITNFH